MTEQSTEASIRDTETWLRHTQNRIIEFLNAEVQRKIRLKNMPNNGCTCDQLEEPDKEEGWTCYWCYENDIE